jgi:hypothetical protein
MMLNSTEVWTAAGVLGALLLSGIVGKVWGPMRKTIAAIDALAGRPPRYAGDTEERPGLVERLDRIDMAIGTMSIELAAMRSEVDDVKTHVTTGEGVGS